MSFTYEDGKAPVMSHVSFKAQPGEILAFVGPSGGGKTTMLRPMLGLLRPQDGTPTVRLEDGSSELPVSDSTRRLCAYVPQGNRCVLRHHPGQSSCGCAGSDRRAAPRRAGSGGCVGIRLKADGRTGYCAG